MSHFDWSDPYWDPANEGDVLASQGEMDAVPWEAFLMWSDGGWTKVVGLKIGSASLYFDANMADSDGRIRSGIVSMAPVPLETITKITSMVERHRRSLDESQRAAMVFRAVDAYTINRDAVPKHLQNRRFDFLRKAEDQVGIAAGLYEVFVELGRRSPTQDVADALQVSRATAGRLIEQARGRGLLPPARPGTVSISRRTT